MEPAPYNSDTKEKPKKPMKRAKPAADDQEHHQPALNAAVGVVLQNDGKKCISCHKTDAILKATKDITNKIAKRDVANKAYACKNCYDVFTRQCIKRAGPENREQLQHCQEECRTPKIDANGVLLLSDSGMADCCKWQHFLAVGFVQNSYRPKKPKRSNTIDDSLSDNEGSMRFRKAMGENIKMLTDTLAKFKIGLNTGLPCVYDQHLPEDKKCACGFAFDPKQVTKKDVKRDATHHFANYLFANGMHPGDEWLINKQVSVCGDKRLFQSEDILRWFEDKGSPFVEKKLSELSDDQNYFIVCRQEGRFYLEIYYGTDNNCVAGYGPYAGYNIRRYFSAKAKGACAQHQSIEGSSNSKDGSSGGSSSSRSTRLDGTVGCQSLGPSAAAAKVDNILNPAF